MFLSHERRLRFPDDTTWSARAEARAAESIGDPQRAHVLPIHRTRWSTVPRVWCGVCAAAPRSGPLTDHSAELPATRQQQVPYVVSADALR